ncbi:MAG: transcription factor FapR [Firmicutes bacterium]|jgi:acyl-coenzyme A thioesterase PaaI-like protein|nr:transcription factor FapR [Bacillota bacterium]
MVRRMNKKKRQEKLMELVNQQPFLTDEELAEQFGVSVQTIRLDRLELSIPEMRERTKALAEAAYGQLRAMSGQELVGQLLDVELGKGGSSLLKTTEEMGFSKTKVIRGHHIFAQANSLAVALVDSPVVFTATAEIHFLHPVYSGESIFCQAEVVSVNGNRTLVEVKSKVSGREVFAGRFEVVAIETWDAARGETGNPEG